MDTQTNKKTKKITNRVVYRVAAQLKINKHTDRSIELLRN